MLAKHREYMQRAWARVEQALSRKYHPMSYGRRVLSCGENKRVISERALLLTTIAKRSLKTSADYVDTRLVKACEQRRLSAVPNRLH